MCQGRVKRQQRVPENLLATSCSLTCVEILTYVFLAFSLALPARVDRSLGSASHGPLPSSTWPRYLIILLMRCYDLPGASTPVSLQPKGSSSCFLLLLKCIAFMADWLLWGWVGGAKGEELSLGKGCVQPLWGLSGVIPGNSWKQGGGGVRQRSRAHYTLGTWE